MSTERLPLSAEVLRKTRMEMISCQEQARLKQFPQALENVRDVISFIKRYDGSYTMDPSGEVDKVHTLTLDNETIRAMNAGIVEMYLDLVHSGQKEYADKIIKSHKSHSSPSVT